MQDLQTSISIKYSMFLSRKQVYKTELQIWILKKFNSRQLPMGALAFEVEYNPFKNFMFSGLFCPIIVSIYLPQYQKVVEPLISPGCWILWHTPALSVSFLPGSPAHCYVWSPRLLLSGGHSLWHSDLQSTVFLHWPAKQITQVELDFVWLFSSSSLLFCSNEALLITKQLATLEYSWPKWTNFSCHFLSSSLHFPFPSLLYVHLRLKQQNLS